MGRGVFPRCRAWGVRAGVPQLLLTGTLVGVSLAGIASPAEADADADAVRAELRASLAKPAAAQAAVSGDEDTLALLARGHEIWTRRFANGRNLAGCFPNGGIRLATAHPRFDSSLGRVITLETALNQCLKAHNEPLLDPIDPQSMGALTAYVRYLAAGQRLAIRVDSGPAHAAFASGREFFFSSQGPGRQSCANCHAAPAGQAPESDRPPPPALALATRWPSVKEGRALTLQAHARECLEIRMQAPAVGALSLDHLDFFLSYLASGDPIVPNPATP